MGEIRCARMWIRKARKQHKCQRCSGIIRKGDYHIHHTAWVSLCGGWASERSHIGHSARSVRGANNWRSFISELQEEFVADEEKANM